MNKSLKDKRGWRVMRRILITLAVAATLIAFFYTEEDWRGKRAWENCKSQLEAKGETLDWNAYIPPPVPDDQNFFTASTNILSRFKKTQTDVELKMATNCSWLLITYSPNSFPELISSTTRPLVVAGITVGPSSVDSAIDGVTHSNFFSLNDKDISEKIQDLICTTVGRGISGAAGFQFSELQLSNLAPINIVLQSDTTPSMADLGNLIPEDLVTNIGHLRIVATENEKFFQVELTGVHITAAADYLKWSDQFVPAFDEIREALKRPYAVIPGDYSQPLLVPIPNFITLRSVAQTLAQRAQCEFLLGQPDKALQEITLIHDVCRILERPPAGKPITLVEAMINVAIMRLYAATIDDGFRLHSWQEAQLSALQNQLKEVNLLPQVAAAFESESARTCFTLINTPPSTLFTQNAFMTGTPANLLQKLKYPEFDFLTFAPRGWVYQNVADYATQMHKGISCYDVTNQLIIPKTADAWAKQISALNKLNPYTFLVATYMPNLTRATLVLAYGQTEVNEAQIACALERFHLQYGVYPGSLDALVPHFIVALPHDIIDGGSLIYRPTNDGKFQLYSIGWNETDDGGKDISGTGSTVNLDKGDWVWKN